MSGTENLAASHEVLAQKIETDVEGPLRKFNSSGREMQAVTSSQGNLGSIAKGLESAQKKAAKGGRKAEEATTSVDEASRSWESQAPYIFEQLQALDERRVNHLRDVLTQFQTHEVDQVERNRASAESFVPGTVKEFGGTQRITTTWGAGGGTAYFVSGRGDRAGALFSVPEAGKGDGHSNYTLFLNVLEELGRRAAKGRP